METIEDAARDYAIHEYWGVCEIVDCDGMICKSEEDFKAGVEFAQRWISVEEELPPLGIPVTCRYNMFGKEYYWSGTFYTEERVMHFIKKHLMITHWRLIEVK